MSLTRRIEQIPQAATVSLSDRIAIWQNGRTRIGTVADLLAGLIPDPAAVTGSQAALAAILDGLPPLPSDPSLYPAAGGVFRNGDSTGYSITRIYPKAST